MTNGEPEIRKLLFEILDEYTEIIRESGILTLSPVFMGKYYAFNPTYLHDEDYDDNLKLINCIYSVLNDYHINVKSSGYTFLSDAICIVIDHGSLDVCLTKDVYPLIAKKYRIKNDYTVEHDIRNALDAAFRSSRIRPEPASCPMNGFSARPKNKEFILLAVQKVQELLAEEMRE